eukprot:scaffold2458_cov61-Phaeocystis_antarctica.AAC.3
MKSVTGSRSECQPRHMCGCARKAVVLRNDTENCEPPLGPVESECYCRVSSSLWLSRHVTCYA